MFGNQLFCLSRQSNIDPRPGVGFANLPYLQKSYSPLRLPKTGGKAQYGENAIDLKLTRSFLRKKYATFVVEDGWGLVYSCSIPKGLG